MQFNPFKIIEAKKVESQVKKARLENNTSEVFPPIRASIIDRWNMNLFSEKMIKSITKNATHVNWFGTREFLAENNILQRENSAYVISSCDEKDKYSTGYFNCTGIVVVGKDLHSEKQLSIMTHWDSREKEEFGDDLSKAIDNILSKTQEGSINSIVFGGHTNNLETNYKPQVTFIESVFVKKNQKEPTVMTGPAESINNNAKGTAGYFDTQNRRLYIVREEQDNYSLNENYLPHEIDKQNKKWQEGANSTFKF